MTHEPTSTRERLRQHLTRKRITGIVVTLILVATASYYFEEIKQLFPDLVTLQLYVYNRLSRLATPAPTRNWVVGVEIDDQTFFQFLKLGEEDVTDRAFLADLVKAAVKGRAAVIALDINLVADAADNAGACRREGNRALFNAIAHAAADNVPVVLTQGFDYKTMTPLQNIQDGKQTADQLPPAPPEKCTPNDPPAPRRDLIVIADCEHPQDEAEVANPYHPRAGFDLAPEDKRKVPLVAFTNKDVPCRSFALQAAEAYTTVMGWPSIMERLGEKTEGGQQFVYSEVLPEYSHLEAAAEPTMLARTLDKIDTTLGFAKPSGPNDQYAIPNLSAVDVYNHRDDRAWLTDNLAHSIVIIGGHRHAHATPEGVPEGSDWVDYHVGPSGAMVGMYAHANYIQGLLDNRTPLPIGRWAGVFIDLGIAIFVIGIELFWAEQRWHRFLVLVLGAVLLVLTYKIVTVFQLGGWARLLIYTLLLLAIWRMAFQSEARKRTITLLLAFFVIALAYVAATLLGFGLDVLAVTVILIGHDMYDRHLEKRERLLEHAGGSHE